MVPAKMIPDTLEQARRMREFTAVAPPTLKSARYVEPERKLSFQARRNSEEMKQLTRRLSLQAAFTSSPSILATPDQEFYWENLHECRINKYDLAVIGVHAMVSLWLLDLKIASLSLVLDLIFAYLLPKLFITYQGFFSFGEGCLLLQGCMMFVYATILAGEINLKLIGLVLILIMLLNLVPKLSWISKLPYFFLALAFVLVALVALITLPMLSFDLPLMELPNLGLITNLNIDDMMPMLRTIGCYFGLALTCLILERKNMKIFSKCFAMTALISTNRSLAYAISLIFSGFFGLVEYLKLHPAILMRPKNKKSKDKTGHFLTWLTICIPLWFGHFIGNRNVVLAGVFIAFVQESVKITLQKFGLNDVLTSVPPEDLNKDIEYILIQMVLQFLTLMGFQSFGFSLDFHSLVRISAIVCLWETITCQASDVVLPLIMSNMIVLSQ